MKYGYDSYSYMVNDRHIWLYAGEIHYYRFPRAEWKRVLSLAKAAGLNTVSTYVAWNYHEPTEGNWDFTGDRDLGAFIDLAAELGLYVILRPGPYICTEWTGGGIPAWMLTKDGFEERTDEPVFMKYSEIWLRKFMEIAAPRQITRGGNIVCIQNDNEYHGGWDKRTTDYIRKITEILRDAGCEVAVTACNCHAPEGKMAINYDAKLYDPDIYKKLDMPVTYNTCSNFHVIKELHDYQPGKPVMLSELWTGPMVFWQKPIAEKDMCSVAEWIAECTLRHAMVTMYMFVGGTNFGFYAAANLATSYASAYPVGDALQPRPKYYSLKPFGAFLSRFGDEIAGIHETEVSAAHALAARFETEKGCFTIIRGEKPVSALCLGGKERNISFAGPKCGVLAEHLPINGSVLDWSDLFLLSTTEDTVLLYGKSGESYTFSVDGTEYTGIVRTLPQLTDTGKIRIAVLDENMAEHTWFLRDRIVIGGDLVLDDEPINPGEFTSVYELKDGILRKEEIKPEPKLPSLPELVFWEKNEPFADTEYHPIDKPHFHEKLGALHGYVLYRGRIHSDTSRSGLLTTSCMTTRAVVLVNGVFAGELGERCTENERFNYANPADCLRERIGIQLQKGENEILLLSEDTGRRCLDTAPLGFEGDIYVDSRMISVNEATYTGKTPLSDAALDYLYSPALTEKRDVDTLSLTVNLAADEKLILIVHDAPCYVQNADIPLILKRPWQSFGEKNGGSALWHCYLPDCHAGENEILIQCPGDPEVVISHAKAYIVKDSDRIRNWEWGSLPEMPSYTERVDYRSGNTGETDLLVPYAKVISQNNYSPMWYTTSFPRPDAPHGLFLSMGNMRKGQIYLNGYNIGRFMSCPAQSRYYLPACWLKDQNTLSIFEEFGIAPDGVKLER